MNHCIFVVFFSTFTKSGIADIIGGTGLYFRINRRSFICC